MSWFEKVKQLFKKKDATEEPEINPDWGSHEPEATESDEVVESSWPPNTVKRKRKIIHGDTKIKFGKVMMVVYMVLSIGTFREPMILLLFVPTLLIIMDYITCNRTLKKMGAWSETEEIKIDNDSIASVE